MLSRVVSCLPALVRRTGYRASILPDINGDSKPESVSVTNIKFIKIGDTYYNPHYIRCITFGTLVPKVKVSGKNVANIKFDTYGGAYTINFVGDATAELFSLLNKGRHSSDE